MSLAQRTKTATKRRIGGPRQIDQGQVDQGDAPDVEFEDLGSGSTSHGSDNDSQESTGEPAQSSSAAAGSATLLKSKKKADPPQGPTRRSTRLVTSVPTASRQLSGKEEASSPVRKAAKTQKNKQRTVRDDGEDVFAVDEQGELLLRDRSMQAMEQRLLSALRKEMRSEQQAQQLAAPAGVPSSVTKALYSISALKEKAFDVWLSHVDDAFRGAGMTALFRASAVRNDSLADPQDLHDISQFPQCWMDAAWTALRQAIGGDDTAYSMSMSVKKGDVLSLLRAVRSFYERRAIPHQTQLRKELIKISVSDYPDVKHYIAALELIFNKLAALDDVVPDQVRRFHLIEGLTDEYHSVVSSVSAYESPHGAQADYAKAVQIISSYDDSFLSKRRKGAQETTMLAQASSTRGSMGDAPARTQGGGDARPRGGREPCVQFLQGKCRKGAQCRYRHIQQPSKNGNRRTFNAGYRHGGRSSTSAGKRTSSRLPGRRQQGNRPTCHNCGLTGHFKRDCRKQNDTVKTAFDFALPAVEFLEPEQDNDCAEDMVNVAEQQQSKGTTSWLLDGGATCHVLGFDPGAALQNRRQVNIEILVGGGRRITCKHVGDLVVVLPTSNPKMVSRLTLKAVRIVPGFGSNLLSTPCMERAGWFLTQGGGQFVAKDGQHRTVFVIAADFKGLYYLNNVTILQEKTPVATALDVRGHWKFSSQADREISKTSQFFPMGVNGKTFQVQPLSSTHVLRPRPAQDSRYSTHSRFDLSVPARREVSNSSAITAPSSILSRLSNPQHSMDELAFRLQGEDVTYSTVTSSNVSPGLKHTLNTVRVCNEGVDPVVSIQKGLSQVPVLPQCYSGGACTWCTVKINDHVSAAVAVSAAETKRLMDAHVRFGHRNFKSLAKALNLRMPAKIPFCRACVEAKSTRHPKSVLPRPLREPAPRPGYRLHFDPFGPFPERLADGSFYGLLFADAYSTVLWFDTLPTLKDWFTCLKSLILKIEADKGSERVVAQLASDSAPMFKNSFEYRRFADSKGIALLFSAPYTQKFNAPVERPIRTLVDMAIAMARHANTPKKFMHLAMKFAVRLLNRLFRRMPDGSTDVPLWRYKGMRVPLNLDRLHPWGCAVHVHIEKSNRSRFDAKSFPCVFFGYDDAASAAILGKLPGMSIIYSAHGKYDDDDFPCRGMGSRVWDSTSTYDNSQANPSDVWFGPSPDEPPVHTPVLPEPQIHPSPPVVPVQSAPSFSRTTSSGQEATSGLQPESQGSSTLRRSKRTWCPSSKALEQIVAGKDVAAAVDDLLKPGEDSSSCVPQPYENPVFQSEIAFATQDLDVPRTYAQILRLPLEEKEKWIAACRRECQSHLQIPSISGPLNQSEWTQAPAVRLTWVFAKKDVYKARIVMLGQHMQGGVHFNDTHAPVPSVTCVRLILALTASEQRHLTQMDVKTAFLNAPIDIELDVLLPEGFGIGTNDGQYSSAEGRRRRALTAIPGCPQGSRVWRRKIVGVLLELGFSTFLPDEPCLFKDSGLNPIFLVLWVDDIVVSAPSNDMERRQTLSKGLQSRFPHGITITNDTTKVFHLLGCVVERPTPNLIRVHQKPFLEHLIRKAGFEDGRASLDEVPVSPSTRFSKTDCMERAQGDKDHRWYRSVIMSMNHAQNWTRPDLTYLVTKGAKFMQAPGEVHMRALKKGLRYLRGRTDLGLVYDFRKQPSRTGLYGFFDASHADDIDTRKSTIAYVFFFSGCAISWKSKLHSFVTTSTNHSELVAAAMASREAKFLWKFFGAINIPPHDGLKSTDPVDLFTDSMGVVAIARNAVLTSATKHIEIADFYVRELVARGIITVAHVPTGFMLADVFTKPLTKIKFFRFINAILGSTRIEDSCFITVPQRKGGKERQVRHFRYSSEFEDADKEVAVEQIWRCKFDEATTRISGAFLLPDSSKCADERQAAGDFLSEDVLDPDSSKCADERQAANDFLSEDVLYSDSSKCADERQAADAFSSEGVLYPDSSKCADERQAAGDFSKFADGCQAAAGFRPTEVSFNEFGHLTKPRNSSCGGGASVYTHAKTLYTR